MDAFLKRIALAAALLALSAPAMAQEEVQLEPLPAQDLRAGACGMFLWSLGEEPTLVLAAFNDPSEARVRTGGDVRRLRRSEQSGATRLGIAEQQSFSDGRLTLNVEVSFDDTRTMRGGAFVNRGVIRVVGRDGWETMIPARGMVACKT